MLDLGAYENQSELPLLTISPSVTADAGFVQLDASATIQLDLTNTGKQDFTSPEREHPRRWQGVLPPDAGPGSRPGAGRIAPGGRSPSTRRERRSTGASWTFARRPATARTWQVALKGVGVSGTVVPAGSVSGTWKKSASPYVVTGDITIPPQTRP